MKQERSIPEAGEQNCKQAPGMRRHNLKVRDMRFDFPKGATMKHVQTLMLCTLVVAAATTLIEAKEPAKPSQVNAAAQGPSTNKSDRGQKVFAENCSRCHNAPQGFSTHISGTIARHMRVRASLSEEDYKALRKFLSAE